MESFVTHIEDTLKEKVYGPVKLDIVKGKPPVHPDVHYPNYNYLIVRHLRDSIFGIVKSALYLTLVMHLLFNWKSNTMLFLFISNLILVYFGLAFINQTGITSFSKEGYNIINMINSSLIGLDEMTMVEKLMWVYDVFLTICLYHVLDFALDAIAYFIGWLNVIVVPSGNTWSIITKPCRYIMLLALYVAAGAVIGSNLFLGYNSIQTPAGQPNEKALKIRTH